MILSEASEKYGMPLDRLCRAVSAAGVEPVGEKQGKRKMLKDYDEKQLVDAMVADYKRSFLTAKHTAEQNKIKANRVIVIYRKDHPEPIRDDDD